ncbi:DUF5693 family protein [Neomoorella humiferrea]|uniref:DUF5693 family protein n=1 Tax=Neomoorella humiferrea TaxID=676965 RepID=UPI003D90F6CE
MSRWHYQRVLWALIIIAALSAGVVITNRVRLEEANRTVTLAVDFQQVQKIARWSGLTTGEVLQRFKQRGINAVLFKEQTIDDLKQQVWLQPADQAVVSLPASERGRVRPGYTYLFTGDASLAARLALHLQNKIPGGVQLLAGDGFTALGVPLSPEELKDVGLGFPEKEMAVARDAGLLIVPQVRSWYGVNANSLAAVLKSLEAYRDDIVALLFNDKRLPGYPLYLSDLAALVEELQVPVGLIEFFPQQGLNQLALLLDKKAVRVHSIGSDEIMSLTPAAALERLKLAARERNNRLLIVRFNLAPASNDWLNDSLAFVGKFRTALMNDGLVIGHAVPFAPLPFSRLWIYLIGLGVLAAGVLLLAAVGLSGAGVLLGLLGLGAWTGVVGLNIQLLFMRKVMALGAAVVFPALAVITALSPSPRSLKAALAVTLRTTLISFLGALYIAAILADNTFILKINEFSGVKVAFVAPLLIFTAAAILRQEGEKAGATIRGWLDANLTVKLVLLAAAVAVGGLLYLSRSGNEGVGLLPLEGQMRSFLTDVLFARPRTKEFLLGYPFLLLSLSLGYRHRFLLFWLLGLVGQISLVNTFSHIHIPFLISLLRTFNGLWLGLFLGLVLVTAVNSLRAYLRRKEAWPG